jgi:tRNA pseudouridine13 synthase
MYKIKEKPEDFVVNEITNLKLQDKGNYCIFLLKKINYTTEKSVQTIANKLRIPRKNIGYAGNKDKIAITTQYISIKNARIKELELKEISLELKGYIAYPISLGDLEGNEFIINVITDKKPKKITKITNYFGEQRFSTNNIEIGKSLIQKDFKKAAELIDDRKVQESLKEKPNDFIRALRKLPMKILKIYVHAYQSYLWNLLAEENKNLKTNKRLNIIGFDTDLTKEEESLLKKEGINKRDFIIRQIPDLTVEGTGRDLFTEISNLKINKIEKGYNLKFKLKKGCYATEVIKQLF